MKWWIAYVVMYEKFRDGVQDYYPIMEDEYLIYAPDIDKALAKAKQIGIDSEFDRDTWFCNDRPAIHSFAGVRKIVECIDPLRRPKHGTEVSYSRILIDTKESLENFLEGRPVSVTIEE